MANSNIVDGFKPYGACLRARPYIASAAIYPGDGVKQEAAGRVAPATAVAALCGVALTYAAAAGDEVLVADHPDQEFTGQADDATIAAQTDCGLNYSLVAGSPNTTYRRSGMQIDASTQDTAATVELKVLRLLPQINNAFGANAKVIFKINNHQLGQSTGTAGV